MRYLRGLFMISLLVLMVVSISKNKIYAEEAEVPAGKVGSFCAQIFDENGNPIPNVYVSIGEWGAITSPNGILYLDKLPLGRYEIMPYVGGKKASIGTSVEINRPKVLIKQYYIYDWPTKTMVQVLKPPTAFSPEKIYVK